MKVRILAAPALMAVGGVAGAQSLEAVLSSPEPAGLIHFGQSVAINDETIVVGSVGFGPTVYKNDLHIFELIGGAWERVLTTRGHDTVDRDYFASSLAIKDDRIVASADGHAGNTGAAYVFRRSGGWTEEAKLVAAMPALDNFGAPVAIVDDRIIVGAYDDRLLGAINPAGVIRVFEHDGSGWVQIQRLISPDTLDARDFGRPLAAAGEWLFAGDPGFGDVSGAVYAYRYVDGVYRYRQRLESPTGAERSRFGVPIAVSGENLVIAARHEAVAGVFGAGAAHLYTLHDGVWEYVQTVESDRAGVSSEFGSSSAIHGDRVALGTWNYRRGNVVRVFDRTPGGWVESFRVPSPEPELSEHFGFALALSEDRLLVSDIRSSTVYPGNIGAVFVYRLEAGQCYADCDESGNLDFFDFLCFQNDFASGASSADCDGSGAIDFLDFVCFQSVWVAGCP